MTVEIETNWVRHLGNGVTTQFPYTFRITDMATVLVSLQSALSGAIIRDLDPGEYTITGVNPDNYAGGEVTYPLSGPALEDDTYLLIQRIVPYKQELDIENQGGFYPESVEYQLDKLEFQIQQLKTATDGAIIVPPGVEPPDVTEIEAWAAGAAESAAQAETARDFAREWASNPEDVLVDDTVNPPGYSSYHWAQKAEEYSGSVQFPVSYGVAQSLSTSQRLQAQANIGVQPRVTPQMFGAVADGIADDTGALSACIASGLPIDWGSFMQVYRITAPLEVTAISDIDWIAHGASLFFDPPSSVQLAMYLNLDGNNFSLFGGLHLDANNMAFQGVRFRNHTDTEVDLYVEGLSVESVYRADTSFTGGDGIIFEGLFRKAYFYRPTIKNVLMAAGAGISGSQGVSGITGKASSTSPFRAPKLILLEQPYIENVYSEDPNYTADQDGAKLFGAEDLPGLDAPYETRATVLGGWFKNCHGRSLKFQTDYGVVSQTHFIRTTGWTGGVGRPEIDFQVGGGRISDITGLYEDSVPSTMALFRNPTTASKFVPNGSIDGVNVAVKGAVPLDSVYTVVPRNALAYQVMADDINVTGPHNFVGRLLLNSGGAPGGATILSGVICSPATALIMTSGNNTRATVTTRDCVNLGGAVPLYLKSSSSQIVDLINRDCLGFTRPIQTLVVDSGAITVGYSDLYGIDTEGASAADELETINGGVYEGQIVTLRIVNNSRDVTLKDSTGNLRLNGDCVLDHSQDRITLMWAEAGYWAEITRSLNT